jgi:hypothetical protein
MIARQPEQKELAMMATAALVILGVILVLFGILASGVSYPLITLGIVALIAAGILQLMATRRS